MLNVAIQAARVGTIVAPHLPKIYTAAKVIAVVVATDIALNEGFRAAAKRSVKRTEKAEFPERFETTPERPFWKKATNTHHDETWGQGVGRRTRVMWDIVCFGIGDAIAVLNLFTFKVARMALWFIRGVVNIVSAGIRFCDTKIDKLVTRLERRRHAAPFMKEWAKNAFGNNERFQGTWDEAIKAYNDSTATKEETPTTEEVTVEEPILKPVPTAQADIHHIIRLVTMDEQAAKRNPKKFGTDMFEQIQGDGEAAVQTLRDDLEAKLREEMGLNSQIVVLVLQGFDAARAAASTNATS